MMGHGEKLLQRRTKRHAGKSTKSSLMCLRISIGHLNYPLECCRPGRAPALLVRGGRTCGNLRRAAFSTSVRHVVCMRVDRRRFHRTTGLRSDYNQSPGRRSKSHKRWHHARVTVTKFFPKPNHLPRRDAKLYRIAFHVGLRSTPVSLFITVTLA